MPRKSCRTLGENVPLYPCDVSSDEEIAKFFQEVRGQTDRLDLLLHSVAFAPKEALEGDAAAQAFAIAQASILPSEMQNYGRRNSISAS